MFTVCLALWTILNGLSDPVGWMWQENMETSGVIRLLTIQQKRM